MKERPILFNGPMVRALLDGRKSQTRRIADTGLYAIDATIHGAETAARERDALLTRCPFGRTGDRLWVRETWSSDDGKTVHYRADGETYNAGLPWRPSIHMPRWAYRITVEVTEVRIERLQDITEEDAKAEGLASASKDGQLVKWGIPDRDGLPGGCDGGWAWTKWDADPREAFRKLWGSVYGNDPRMSPSAWDANPWVWVTCFRRVQP